MTKRTEIAKDMAKNEVGKTSTTWWLNIIYAFERQGYQVVKVEETAEYQGLRLADGKEDEDGKS